MAVSESYRQPRGSVRGLILPVAVIFGILAMFVIGWMKSWTPDASTAALPAQPPVPSSAPLAR